MEAVCSGGELLDPPQAMNAATKRPSVPTGTQIQRNFMIAPSPRRKSPPSARFRVAHRPRSTLDASKIVATARTDGRTRAMRTGHAWRGDDLHRLHGPSIYAMRPARASERCAALPHRERKFGPCVACRTPPPGASPLQVARIAKTYRPPRESLEGARENRVGSRSEGRVKRHAVPCPTCARGACADFPQPLLRAADVSGKRTGAPP